MFRAEEDTLKREIAARVLDALTGVLLAYLFWRLFFGPDESFHPVGLACGAAGTVSAWLRRETIRTPVDIPVLALLALVVCSTAVNASRFEPPPHVTVWQPSMQAGCYAAFFYGLAAWLKNRARMVFLNLALVATIAGIGIAADYDYLTLSIAWRRLAHYPSVAQWSGYPQIGLLLSLALPFPLALLVVAKHRMAVVASAILTAVFVADLIMLNSRSALVVVAAVYAALATAESIRFRRYRLWLAAAVPAGILAVLIAPVLNNPLGGEIRYWLRTRLYLQYVTPSGPSASEMAAGGYGRFTTWRHAGELIRDSPLLGVGPGKYSAAFRGKFASRPYEGGEDAHAHNSFVHIAAETGIPAAVAFAAIWIIIFRDLVRAWSSGRNLLLVLAISGVLLTYLLRSVSDHFQAMSLQTSTRVSFLMWMIIAMGVAASRLARRDAALSA